jgi:hypothetical protein
MVKWAARKESHNRLSAAMQHSGKDGRFTVDITGKENRFVNYLDLRANLLLPSGREHTFGLQQIAPGRYEGRFPAAEIGAYFFSVYGSAPAYTDPPQAFGFGIPYTEEFNRTKVNDKLLEELAATTKGRMLSVADAPKDLFRDPSDSRESDTPLWPYFILAFLLLLIADVAVRKVMSPGGSY